MRYGSLWERLVRGVRWSWIDPRYRSALPPDLDASVMKLDSRDRLHAKQGRSTARVIFHPAEVIVDRTWGTTESAGAQTRPVAVYLKRHFRLPWLARLAALFDPAGRHSPAAAEWDHLERARGARCAGSRGGGDRRAHRSVGLLAKLPDGGRASPAARS